MRLALRCALLGLALRGGTLAADQAANRWTPLGDGAFRLLDRSNPDLSGSRLLWIADRDCALVAPLLTGRPSNWGAWTLTHGAPTWKFTPSSLPDG